MGKVKHAVFHTQKAGRKRVVVSTEENVVVSLDLRRGDIFWRHVLGPNDAVDEIDIALGKYVITLSSEGSILRAWNLPDGQMVWESFLQSSKSSKSSVPAKLKIDKDNLIFVFGKGCLHAVSTTDGEVLWKKDFEDESLEGQQIIHPIGSDIIYAVGLVGSSQFDAYQIDIKNGEVLKHRSSAFPGGFCREASFVSSHRLVALDSTRSSLISIIFLDGEISLQQTHISDLVGDSFERAAILPSKLAGMLILKINNFMVVVRVTDEGKLELIEKINDAAAFSDALTFSEGQQAFGLVEHGGSKIHLAVKLVNDWNVDLLKERIGIDYQRGCVHKIFINNYIRTDKSHGFRALIVMEDHSLLLLQQGVIVWSREGGLASIIDVTTSELPVEKEGVSVAKVEHNLSEWLKGHMLKLKGTLMLASPEDIVSIQGLRLKSSEKSKMTRDHNGFRKLLIVLTRAGKLFALHTGDGRIVWPVLLHSLRKSEACAYPTVLNVYQWQVPHHHAMDENPSVLVVGRCGLGPGAPGVLSFVDTYMGKELDSLILTHSIERIIPLSFTDSREQRLHLIIDTNHQAHLYPKTPEAIGIFQNELPNIYWYSVEADNGIIRGYALKSNCIQEGDVYCFDTRYLWSIVFPSESEKIIATVSRKSNEV